MKKIYLSAIMFLIFLVTGCAGTKAMVDQKYNYLSTDSFKYEIVNKANMSDQGMGIFKDKLKAILKEEGLLSDNFNKIIEITITNYRMRHGATRALVGIMAGSDNITSTVIIKDKGTAEVVGKMQVISKNPTAWGTSKGMIEGHAEEILAVVKSGKQ